MEYEPSATGISILVGFESEYKYEFTLDFDDTPRLEVVNG